MNGIKFLPLLTAALAMLASCSSPPLADFNGVAVARPLVTVGSAASGARISDLVGRAVARAVTESRFSLAGDLSRCDATTAVIHARIEAFEPAGEDRAGAARTDFLVADLAGNPIAAGRSLSIGRFCEGQDPVECLALEVGRASGAFLEQVGGPGPSSTRAQTGQDSEVFFVKAAAPRNWPPTSFPGRLRVFARLAMPSPGAACAGGGRGSPRYDEAFTPSPGLSVGAAWSLCPGFSLDLAGGKTVFGGKRFSSSGLSVDFDDLELLQVTAGARFAVPLSSFKRRWWSTWEPFADTRGANAFLRACAGCAYTEPLFAVVIEDMSGEVPTLIAGQRIPYFNRGVVGICELALGLEVRAGPDKGPVVTAALSFGLFAAGPPPPASRGSESQMIAGPAASLEIGLAF